MTATNEMVDLPLDEIKIGERSRTVLPRIAELAASIDEVGLLQPIIVNPEHRLIGGQRRLEAFRFLNRKTIPCYVVPITDALLLLKAQRDENTQREPLLPSEAVAQGKQIEVLVAAEAQARMTAGKKPSSNLDEGSTGRTDATVAAAVGMGKTSYRKAKAVVEAAKADPALQSVLEEMDQSGKVDPAGFSLDRGMRRGRLNPV